MNGYWVSYEMNNGQIGTWSDYASTDERFIRSLLARENDIKKFIELVIDERKGKKVDPQENIPVGKYNRMLKSK